MGKKKQVRHQHNRPLKKCAAADCRGTLLIGDDIVKVSGKQYHPDCAPKPSTRSRSWNTGYAASAMDRNRDDVLAGRTFRGRTAK